MYGAFLGIYLEAIDTKAEPGPIIINIIDSIYLDLIALEE